ncbi:hypothetical protein F9C07_3137 [Aspergillus flavus]|uniref:Uncharacterized protein n=1 Tax=Aspergillus flavus (strain ATCC 200026 / FGSC A1120 / IAM 13836 / NRRL 3357 / JCM 12722 / SRRC 167) TaxID=332952 RepID=A0A7U2MEM7_ASPFN|nr:hypothetical protein F9C07_3137 [Aspergillus flavus]
MGLSPLRIEVDLAETGLGLETKTKTTSSNHGPEEMEELIFTLQDNAAFIVNPTLSPPTPQNP